MLEGFVLGTCLEFDKWQDNVRLRVQEQFDALLETLCRGQLRAGRTKSALPFAQQRLEVDHLHEAAHRLLMEIHVRMGRADLARKQFEACARTLAREDIEPEEQTLGLCEAIREHRLHAHSALPVGRDADVALAAASRQRWQRIARAAAGTLVAASIIATYFSRRFILGSDLPVAAVETFGRGEELDRVRISFHNDGIALRNVRYSVAFSSDQTVVAPHDYVVYEEEVTMSHDGELTVDIDRSSDIQEYLDAHSVRIPPGTYFVTITIDPEERIWEDSRLNNRFTNSTRFFDEGTAPEAAFAVDITYAGPGTLDEDDPLKLFIGDGSDNLFDTGAWARFVVSDEGTYFLPVADVPHRDSNGSGYVLVAIHDIRNDLDGPAIPGPGDVSAIYTGRSGNLSYGISEVACGTAVYPGRRYRIEFSPPAPDIYENDDHREIGTIIGCAALPVRQHHTFHNEGTGDRDEDWFQITLGNGETLTVETYSAGGAWECDTAIDFSDSEHFIRLAKDNSEYDLYSRLSYTNTTGVERLHYVQVRPYDRYAPGINRFADYIVEFRR